MAVYNPESMTISTRGHGRYSFSDAIIVGLAPDGGLLVPEQYTVFSMDYMQKMRKMNYTELAFSVLERFIRDIPPQELDRMLKQTYSKKKIWVR